MLVAMTGGGIHLGTTAPMDGMIPGIMVLGTAAITPGTILGIIHTDIMAIMAGVGHTTMVTMAGVIPTITVIPITMRLLVVEVATIMVAQAMQALSTAEDHLLTAVTIQWQAMPAALPV